MTDGQYRAIVAYLNYWTPRYINFDLDMAIVDIGITDSREDVIAFLWKTGHTYQEDTKRLVWAEEDGGGEDAES